MIFLTEHILFMNNSWTIVVQSNGKAMSGSIQGHTIEKQVSRELVGISKTQDQIKYFYLVQICISGDRRLWQYRLHIDALDDSVS